MLYIRTLATPSPWQSYGLAPMNLSFVSSSDDWRARMVAGEGNVEESKLADDCKHPWKASGVRNYATA
jgi:hypothetical protein